MELLTTTEMAKKVGALQTKSNNILYKWADRRSDYEGKYMANT